MRIFSLLSLSAFLLICCGCADVPEELRNLIPVSVTVKNGDQPVAGIQIILLAKASQGAFACNGVTDANGMTQIQSSRGSFTGKGVPAGTYTVVLSEPIEVPEDLLSQESDQDLSPAAQAEKARKLDEFLKKNQVVPTVLTIATTSPVEVTVAKGQNATVEIDVTKHR